MLNCIEWEIIYWKYIQSKSCKIRRQIFGRRRYTNIKAKYGEEVEYRNIKAKYREAAQIISESPAALQLRYLQVSLSTLFSETFSMSLSFSSLYVKFWWPLFLALKFPFLFLKGSKRDQNGQHKCFWSFGTHFGPIWTLLDHFRQKWFFCPKWTK